MLDQCEFKRNDREWAIAHFRIGRDQCFDQCDGRSFIDRLAVAQDGIHLAGGIKLAEIMFKFGAEANGKHATVVVDKVFCELHDIVAVLMHGIDVDQRRGEIFGDNEVDKITDARECHASKDALDALDADRFLHGGYLVEEGFCIAKTAVRPGRDQFKCLFIEGYFFRGNDRF